MKFPHIFKSKLELMIWIGLGVLGSLVGVVGLGYASQEMVWWLWVLCSLAILIGLITVIYLIYLIFSIRRHDVRNVILSIILLLVLCVGFFIIDKIDGATRVYKDYWRISYDTILYTWAPEVSTILVASCLYVVLSCTIHQHAQRNGRNVIRWTTASLVFTPLLAGIAYLLTWPGRKTEDKQSEGQQRN